MNCTVYQLRGMTEDQLYAFSEAIDLELDRLVQRRIARGYLRSTFMKDLARGKRHAPRTTREIRLAA